MFNKIWKAILSLGGLMLVTACTSHRTVYVSRAHVAAAPETVVVVTPAPDIIVFEEGKEYLFYEWRHRRYCPYYYSRGYFVPRYYIPGYYDHPIHVRPRSHLEFQFGMGFSRRFR